MSKPEHGASSSRDDPKEKSALLLRVATFPIAVRLRHLAGLLLNAKTLGVRVAAFDEAGAVFLVRHTYMAGWHLPGGGVDAGETAEEAALRELREEGNIVPAGGTLRLRSIHFHRTQLRRDHVLFFAADGIRQTEPRIADREIAECGFFAPDALPDGISSATLRRLAELRGEASPDPDW